MIPFDPFLFTGVASIDGQRRRPLARVGSLLEWTEGLREHIYRTGRLLRAWLGGR